MSNNPLRKIGDTDVPALGYGAMGLAAFYDTLTKQEDVDKVFNLLLSKGVTHWDTSDIYSTRPSLGEGEEQIGAYFAAHPDARSKVFLATKHGFVIHDDGSRGVQAGKEYALQACAASLKRLQTDHIDLYYQHRAIEPIEETFEGLKQLQKEGKIKHIGVSEYNLEQLERANKVAHIDAIQIEFSPWTPDILSNGVLDWAKKNKTAIVAYSPLGRGFLSGAIKSPEDLSDSDFRKSNPRFQGENFKKNLELVEQLKKIADRKSAKPGQIALAWLLAQADNVHVIPGSTKPANILENIGALDVKLFKEDLEEINGIVGSFKVQGDRYSGPMKNLVHF